jgi:hypothetical protein
MSVNNDGALLPSTQYFAAPGLREGTWMVVAQRGVHDPGYGVLSPVPSRDIAEAEAVRLNGHNPEP